MVGERFRANHYLFDDFPHHNHDQILEFLRKMIFERNIQIYQNYLCALKILMVQDNYC